MSKKLLAFAVVFALAACGGDDEAELDEGFEVEETAPATPAPAPMDTMTMDTTMMSDTMAQDTM